MVSGTRALHKLVVVEVEGEQGSGPEGVDDLCFHTYGEFSPPPPPPHPSPQPLGPNLSLQDGGGGEGGGGENPPFV